MPIISNFPGSGKDGAPGKSAFQSAQENGYTGSEAEFYAALVALKDGPFLPLKGGIVDGTIISRGNNEGETEELELFWHGINWKRGSSKRPVLYFKPEVIEIGGGISEYAARIVNLAAPVDDLDATNKEYVDSKSPKAQKVTLTASGWVSSASGKTQSVTVSGVLADETKQLIMPMPAVASQNAYAAAGIACTAQAANSLTFKCLTVPTEDIMVYVAVQGVA